MKEKKKKRQPDGRGAKGKETKLGEEPRGTGHLGECWGGYRVGRQRAGGPLPALRSARVAWLQDAASRKRWRGSPGGTDEWTAANIYSAPGIERNVQRGGISFDPNSCLACRVPLDTPPNFRDEETEALRVEGLAHIAVDSNGALC